MMLTAQRKHIYRFFSLYFLFIGYTAVFWPFLTFYLMDMGVSATTIGMMSSTATGTAIIGSYLMGYINDRLQRFDLLVLVSFLATFGCMILIENLSTGWLIFVIYVLYGFIESPMTGIMDTWSIECAPREMGQYFGIIRSGGSLGYGILIILSGHIIGKNNFVDIKYLSYVVGLLVFLYMCYLSRSREVPKFYVTKTEKTASRGRSAVWQDLKTLFQVQEYRSLIVICMLLQIPICIVSMFTPYVFETVGGGPAEHAMLLGVSALLEIPFFFLTPYLLSKYRSDTLIVVSSIAVVVKAGLFVVAKSPSLLMVSSLFSTIQFTVFYSGLRYKVSQVAPDHLRTMAQTTIMLFYHSIPGIVAGLGGGWMIDHLGVKISFAIVFCSLVVIIALLLGYLSRHRTNT